MGCSSSQQANLGHLKSELIVVTLNYGGILNSPFEFFSNEEQEEHKISTLFRQLIPFYVKDFDEKTFKWDVGKIDQKIQKERYTPIYQPNVGVVNNKLIGQPEFQKLWDLSYQKVSNKIEPAPTSEQVKNMKLFDLICYHTLLKFVYNVSSLKQIQLGQHSPKAYTDLLQKYYNRSYLNEERKIFKVKAALSKHSADVFCFQQPTTDFIDELKKDSRFYVYDRGSQISMLLIRKSSFMKINDQNYLKNVISNEQLRNLDWDDDTSFIVCDNYIFISAHLCSKKQKNAKQVEEMKKSLRTLREKCKGYQIIVGGDLNSFVTTEGLEEFSAFPNVKSATTTRKKRTFLQPQFNKAEQISGECKDQIFSTLKILKSEIVTIQHEGMNAQPSSTLLPTNEHPFDHLMVICTLKKANRQK